MRKKLFSLCVAAIFVSCSSLVSEASNIVEVKSPPVFVPINTAKSATQTQSAKKPLSQNVKNDLKQAEQKTKNAAENAEKNVKKDLKQADKKLLQTGKDIEQGTKKEINKLKDDTKKQ